MTTPPDGSPKPTTDLAAPESSPEKTIEKIEAVLEAIPADQREQVRQAFVMGLFQGPLPPPDLLDNYEQILPGAAERIFGLTETEQSHRVGWEDRALSGELKYSLTGLWLGAGVVVALFLSAVACAAMGATEIGVALASAGGLASAAGIFVKGRDMAKNRIRGPKEQPKLPEKQKPRNRRPASRRR